MYEASLSNGTVENDESVFYSFIALLTDCQDKFQFLTLQIK